MVCKCLCETKTIALSRNELFEKNPSKVSSGNWNPKYRRSLAWVAKRYICSRQRVLQADVRR